MLYMRCGLKQAVPQRKTVTTPTSALMAVLSHDAMLVRRMLRHCVCPSVRLSVTSGRCTLPIVLVVG